MARKTETINVEIGGKPKAVKITQWGAREASRMLLVTKRFLGPAIATALDDKNKDAPMIARIVDLLGGLGNEDDLTALCEALASASEHENGRDGTGKVHWFSLGDGRWADFFAGHMLELAKWLYSGIALNYAAFLVEAGNAQPASPPANTSSESSSPKP